MAAKYQNRALEGDASAPLAGVANPAAASASRVPRAGAGEPDGFSWRLALFYAAMFVFIGIVTPFFPVWLQAKGLDSRAMGVVLAVPMFMRLISAPLATRATDRRGAYRAALIATSMTSVLAYTWLSRADGFIAIVLAVAVASVSTAPVVPLADAYALKGLGLRGLAYGPVRLWGSAAFIAANLGAGFLIDRIDASDIIWLLVGALAFVAAASIALRPLAGESRREPESGPPERRLLFSPGFWTVTAAAGLIQASHAVFYAFSVLDWRAKGLDAAIIGGLWGLAVLAEIALFAFSARLPSRVGPLGLIGLGAVGGAVRWTVMSLDPPFALLPVVQLLHGLSFGATHLGSMQVLSRIAPERQFATAQGDFSTLLALIMAGAMMLAGVLYADFGSGAYGAMALAATAGGGFVLLARRFVREPIP
jgi:PPP family 3-phenylpropionic acid transporter